MRSGLRQQRLRDVIDMGTDNKKLAYNVGGAVLGIVLAALATFGVIAASSASQPQTYGTQISYNSPN